MSSFEIIDVFAVHQGDDDRSCGTPRWFFRTKQEAVEISAGRGWYGGNAPVGKMKAVQIGDVAFLLASTEPIEIGKAPEDEAERRAAALAKLSPSERKILGLE